MGMGSTDQKFVVCVNNDGYPVSLELKKIYLSLPDEKAKKHGMVRVVDESGEDYLYPTRFFVPIKLPMAVREVFRHAA